MVTWRDEWGVVLTLAWQRWHCMAWHATDGHPTVISAMRHQSCWQKANQWFWANSCDRNIFKLWPNPVALTRSKLQRGLLTGINFPRFCGFPDDIIFIYVSVSPRWLCSNPSFQRSSACGDGLLIQTLISNQSQPANSPNCAHAFDNTTLFRNN